MPRIPAPVDAADVYAALAATDPVLGDLVERYGTPDPFAFPDGGRTLGNNFAAMCLHILGQQISTRAALVLYDRLVETLGGLPSPEQLLALGPDPIKALGASRSKAGYLVGLAERVHVGSLDLDQLDSLDDKEAVVALRAVKGIGQWSAEMFLIHQLHRPDILPAGDLAIRRAVACAYQLPTTPTIAETRDLGARWAPYRTYASGLLWRSLASARAGPASRRSPILPHRSGTRHRDESQRLT